MDALLILAGLLLILFGMVWLVALAFGRYDTLPTDTPLFWQLVADLLLPMIAHTQDAALETDA